MEECNASILMTIQAVGGGVTFQKILVFRREDAGRDVEGNDFALIKEVLRQSDPVTGPTFLLSGPTLSITIENFWGVRNTNAT